MNSLSELQQKVSEKNCVDTQEVAKQLFRIKSLKISVIIPFFNGKKYIDAAIESIISQTLQPCELYIIDDGSTVNAIEQIKEVKANFPIHIIRRTAQSGQSAARNHGVSLSVGDYIAFLDQDDFWHPHHLEKLAEPFLSDIYRLGWTYSNFDEIDANGHLISTNFLDIDIGSHPKKTLFDMLKQDNFIVPSAALVFKEAFEEVNGFDERLSGYEDDDLFTRLFSAGWRNRYIAGSTISWRIYGESCSHSTRMDKSRHIFIKKLLETYPDSPRLNRYFTSKGIVPRFLNNYLLAYFQHTKLKDFDRAKEALVQLRECLQMLPQQIQSKWNLIIRVLKWPKLIYFLFHGVVKYFPRQIINSIRNRFSA